MSVHVYVCVYVCISVGRRAVYICLSVHTEMCMMFVDRRECGYMFADVNTYLVYVEEHPFDVWVFCWSVYFGRHV